MRGDNDVFCNAKHSHIHSYLEVKERQKTDREDPKHLLSICVSTSDFNAANGSE